MTESQPMPEINPAPAPAQPPPPPNFVSRTIDDGGPMYPCSSTLKRGFRGLSMRDYFAAMAMQGMMSVAVPGLDGRATVGSVQTATGRSITETAYSVADSMLRAREK